MADTEFPIDHPNRQLASVPLVHDHIKGRLLSAIQERLPRKDLVFSGEVLRVRRSRRHWFFTVRGSEEADPRLGLQIILPADQPEPMRGQMVRVKGHLDARVRDRCQVDFVVEGLERCDDGGFAARYRKQVDALEALQAAMGDRQILTLDRPIKRAVGLVTGHMADAAADFERGLNPFGERHPLVICPFKAPLEDPTAVAGMIRAATESPQVEVIVIVRGGGDPLGIHAFDHGQVLEAIAQAVTRKFVLLGIGHAEDWSAAEELASHVEDVPQSAGAWLRRRHRQLYWQQNPSKAPRRAQSVLKGATRSVWRRALRWLLRILLLGIGVGVGWAVRPILDDARGLTPVSAPGAPGEPATREHNGPQIQRSPSPSERRRVLRPKGHDRSAF